MNKNFSISKAIDVVCNWNHKKDWKNFKELYKYSFVRGNFIFRIYKIIKNTKSGTYLKLEKYWR